MFIRDFVITVRPTNTTQSCQGASSSHQGKPCASVIPAKTTRNPADPRPDSLCNVLLPMPFVLQTFRDSI